MIDCIMKHRIALFAISMTLVLTMAYIQEEYTVIVFGMVSSVGVMFLRKHTKLHQAIDCWF